MSSYCEICRQQFDASPPHCGCKIVSVGLTGDEAAALAQFLKRLLLDDFTAKCELHDRRPSPTRQQGEGQTCGTGINTLTPPWETCR